MPGYIRIDSVHQGDQDGMKGVYHINAVDSVTQFQLVATCEKISEAYLLPVIRQLLAPMLPARRWTPSTHRQTVRTLDVVAGLQASHPSENIPIRRSRAR
jgi:hypothetical protein